MPHILAFLNFKGGVGKTTDTVNIAAVLALHRKLAGQRVLVIDLDPQCNATMWLINRDGYNSAVNEGRTIHKLFQAFEDHRVAEIKPLVQIVQEKLATGGRLDLVPGSFKMLELEERGDLGQHPSLVNSVLTKALNQVRDDYDYILIDCPPAWSLFTRNALRAADFVIVPYTPDYMSLEGIKWIGQLQRDFEHKCSPAPVAKLAALIVNRFRSTQPVTAALLEMRQVLEGIGGAQNHRIEILIPYIREAAAVTDATNVQQTLVDERPHDEVTKDFVSVTQNLIALLDRLPPAPHA